MRKSSCRVLTVLCIAVAVCMLSLCRSPEADTTGITRVIASRSPFLEFRFRPVQTEKVSGLAWEAWQAHPTRQVYAEFFLCRHGEVEPINGFQATGSPGSLSNQPKRISAGVIGCEIDTLLAFDRVTLQNDGDIALVGCYSLFGEGAVQDHVRLYVWASTVNLPPNGMNCLHLEIVNKRKWCLRHADDAASLEVE